MPTDVADTNRHIVDPETLLALVRRDLDPAAARRVEEQVTKNLSAQRYVRYRLPANRQPWTGPRHGRPEPEDARPIPPLVGEGPTEQVAYESPRIRMPLPARAPGAAHAVEVAAVQAPVVTRALPRPVQVLRDALRALRRLA